jgi:hypothetical protein
MPKMTAENLREELLLLIYDKLGGVKIAVDETENKLTVVFNDGSVRVVKIC